MPGLGQGSGPGTQREDEYKLNNALFSLMSLRLTNFNVPPINAPAAHLKGYYNE